MRRSGRDRAGSKKRFAAFCDPIICQVTRDWKAMMGHTPEGDDFKAKRLADFSDAIARGENPDARGIDPVDAALIRDLHSLRRDMSPDPKLNARLRAALADHVAAKET